MNKGFTLLEVLVALVILGIALVPLLAAEDNSLGAYLTINAVARETVLARDVMSEIISYPGGVFPLDKKGKVKYDKNFSYTEKIKTTSFPGIFLIEVDVFRNGHKPDTGVVLKSLSK